MSTDVHLDATNSILGRLASLAAKEALRGKFVYVVNCDEALITGKKRSVIGEYKTSRARGGSSMNGPNFPKVPARIMKRTIRGMLPYKQGRGLAALKRVLCYNGVPEKLKDVSFKKMETQTHAQTIKLKDVAKEL